MYEPLDGLSYPCHAQSHRTSGQIHHPGNTIAGLQPHLCQNQVTAMGMCVGKHSARKQATSQEGPTGPFKCLGAG